MNKPVDTTVLVKKGKKEGFLTQEEILKVFPDAEKHLDQDRCQRKLQRVWKLLQQDSRHWPVLLKGLTQVTLE